MKIKKFFVFLLIALLPVSVSWAAWVWSPEQGKFINSESGQGASSAEDLYDSATEFYKDGKPDNAVKQLEELLKKFPQARIASEAQYKLGIIQEEKQDLLKAFQAYKKLLESYPQSERFSEVIGREYEIGNAFLAGRKGKIMGLEILPSTPRAIEVFEHIVKTAPFSDFGDKAQFQLGMAQKMAGNYDASTEALQTVIDQYPKSDLVSQARFQLTEVSFLKSKNQFRDQQALDEAGTQVDRYLERYPGSESSEEAVRIRQLIDEKNAEKSYRVALYYEKENYIDSALIYYQDVATRYPKTQWGEKAQGKMRSLKEPAGFAAEKKKSITGEIATVEAELKGSGAKDAFDQDQLKRRLERLQKQDRSLDKDKRETLERRRQDLARRKGELKEKFKNLTKKEKLIQTNPSEDYKAVLQRWRAALEVDQAKLEDETRQLSDWHKEMGVSERKTPLDFVPFLRQDVTPLDKVKQLEAKKLYQIAEEKKSLLEEKETLYKQQGEVTAYRRQLESDILSQGSQFLETMPVETAELKSLQEELTATRTRLETVETDLQVKKIRYEKDYGHTGWLSFRKASGILDGSKDALSKSWDKSVSVLNPFDAASLREKTSEQLEEQKMHLQERIATEKILIETIKQAFSEELAVQERKKLMEDMENAGSDDPRKLRQTIKKLEKDIRGRIREIEDRDEHKKKMFGELEGLLKIKQSQQSAGNRTLNAVTYPFVAVGRFTRAFFVGMQDKGVQLTQEAGRVPEQSDTETQRIKELKEKIELDSLLIEDKHQEILKLQKDLEILKARASLAGGYKFRSSLVAVPYQFVGEAIESAKKMVPKKNRQDALVGGLHDETERAEKLKADLAAVEGEISRRSGAPVAQAVVAPVIEEPITGDTAPERALKTSIRDLEQESSDLEKSYKKQKSALEDKLELSKKQSKSEKRDLAKDLKEKTGKRAKLDKESAELNQQLGRLVEREKKLEAEETSVLEKKISLADREMSKTRSKLVSQDLLTERKQMEDRVGQLASRRDFLAKELERSKTAEVQTSH